MTTPAQARYIESLRDNRDHINPDLSDDHIQDNIGRIERHLAHFSKAIDTTILLDWMVELVERHNWELECDLDALGTQEASELIDSLKDGYHPALVTNLDEIAVHFMPYIVEELEAVIAKQAEKVEQHIQRGEELARDHANGEPVKDWHPSPTVDEMVEEAVAFYDAVQIEHALGVHGECETNDQAEWTISDSRLRELEARLAEAKKQVTSHQTPQVIGNAVRQASMNLLAGDQERDMIRRYIIMQRNYDNARISAGK
ncbi:hypothetical protein ACUY2G_09720 [Corynebacterium guaraldiae]